LRDPCLAVLGGGGRLARIDWAGALVSRDRSGRRGCAVRVQWPADSDDAPAGSAGFCGIVGRVGGIAALARRD
jgi:hypothetical protein